MTDQAMTLAEQLCAMMDGELPDTQARFLCKRMENDAELREQWSRMHMASSCMKGQPAMPMAPSLSLSVRSALSGSTPVRTGARAPWLRWGVAASLAVLALAMTPRLVQSPEGNTVTGTQIPSTAMPRVLPSPSSADLVAVRRSVVVGGLGAEAPSAVAGVVEASLAATPLPATPSSPMPLDAQSPADYPLVDNGDKRTWPRSQLVEGSSDPSLEAYLVRHNQMLANDGLGGFVPYVDVVARDPASTQAGEGTATSAPAGADTK